jgi:hypothetical protein
MPFLLFPQSVGADAVLDRYVSFMRRSSSLSVSIKVTNSQVPGEGSANLTVAKPNRMAFSVSWSGHQYSFFQDDKHVAEVNRSSKKYREWPSFSGLVSPPSEVSTIGHFSFPKLLLLNDIRQIGGTPKAQVLPKAPGSRNQTVLLKYNTASGQAELEVTIDEFGRPVRSTNTQTVEGIRVASKMQFSNWILDRKYPASIFAGTLEPGYTADALPYEDIPIQADEKFQFKGWVQSGRSGNIQGVLLSKKYVLIAVRSGCEHSVRLLRLLEQNVTQIQRTGGSVGVLSLDGSSIKTTFPTFVESNRNGVRNLRIAGTPTLFSVNSLGITKQVWFPVISDQPKILMQEILSSLK